MSNFQKELDWIRDADDLASYISMEGKAGMLVLEALLSYFWGSFSAG